MYDEQSFSTVRKGFDKDEVISFLNDKDRENAEKVARLEQAIRDKDHEIAELSARVTRRNAKIDELEGEIENKYKEYVEKYEQIGELVYDSRIRADEILAKANAEAEALTARMAEESEAQAAAAEAKKAEMAQLVAESEAEIGKNEEKSKNIIEAGRAESKKLIAHAKEEAEEIVLSGRKKYVEILKDADYEAKKRTKTADAEVDAILADGQRKYDSLREEIKKLAALFDTAQKRFSASLAGVQEMIDAMPEKVTDRKPAANGDDSFMGYSFEDDDEDEYEEEIDESEFEESQLTSATIAYDEAFQAQLPPVKEKPASEEASREEKIQAFETELAKNSYDEDGKFRLPGEDRKA